MYRVCCADECADSSGSNAAERKARREAHSVILALPAPAAARLTATLDQELAKQLARIRYHSSVIVALGFPKEISSALPPGFGFVVPRTERRSMIACTVVTNKFPFRAAEEGVLLRCFLGGARSPAAIQQTDEQIVEKARQELREILKLESEPLFSRVYRWEAAMPQYGVGHEALLQSIGSRLAEHPGLFLAGNGYRGVGIPDCIQSGSVAAAHAVGYLRAGE
jgi:oxygen-dependent protoporphyrinogen oxidase